MGSIGSNNTLYVSSLARERKRVRGPYNSADIMKDEDPECTIKKLNHLIKNQIRSFLVPKSNATNPSEEDYQSTPGDTNGDPSNQPSRHPTKWFSYSQRQSQPPPPNQDGKRTHGTGSNCNLVQLLYYIIDRIHWPSLIELVLCDVILTILIPIILIFVLCNALWRTAYQYYLHVQTGGKVRLMRGEDAFWAAEKPFNPGNFTSLYVIEGKPDLAKIRRKLNGSWIERKDKWGRPMFNKLKLKAAKRGNYFTWEYHTEFDIKEHVKYFHPENPDRSVDETELFEEIRGIYDDILPNDKPQWEILLVPNYKYHDESLVGKNYYVLVFRVHHCIMDGLSASQALRLVVADNVVEAGVDPMKPMKAPWWFSLGLYIYAFATAGPYVLRHLYQKKEKSAFHGAPLRGPKTLGWSRPIRLSAIKKLKQATNSSVTAVFISCIGGAFKALSTLKGEPQPEKVTAVTCAAFLPYPNIKAQNRFCVLFTPLHTKVDDAKERIRLAQEPFKRRFECAAEVVMAYWITFVGGCLPIPICNWLTDGICQGTILLSNLPGPVSTTQIFGGHRITDIIGWSPIRNRIGTAMCLFGYNGRVRANVIADASAFPDPNDVSLFIEAFEKELIALGKDIGLRQADLFTTSDAIPTH